MKLKVKVDSENEACYDCKNAAWFLTQVTNKILALETKGIILDANGNTVGKWSFKPSKETE